MKLESSAGNMIALVTLFAGLFLLQNVTKPTVKETPTVASSEESEDLSAPEVPEKTEHAEAQPEQASPSESVTGQAPKVEEPKPVIAAKPATQQKRLRPRDPHIELDTEEARQEYLRQSQARLPESSGEYIPFDSGLASR